MCSGPPSENPVYANFFGLRELPFNNTPDPRFFFPTPDHEEALASLIYAVRERKGFVLLTGEVGAGKTLVSRMMLRKFGTRIAFANINHTAHGATDLMESVLTEFELDIPRDAAHAQLVRVLQDFLLKKFSQNIPVVLVLDEAQNLPVEVFEQLRMIGNLEADDAKLLQVVIVGQPELQHRFGTRELRQLRQRIFRTYHLPALGREAMEEYITHRLSVAGMDKDRIVFDASAMDSIWVVSRGLPRIINTVCDNTMLSAYSANTQVIDGALVDSVVDQMMMVDPPAEEELILPPDEISLTAQAPAAPPSEHTATGQTGTRAELPAIALDALARSVIELGEHRRCQQQGIDPTNLQTGRETLRRRTDEILNRELDRFEHQLNMKVDGAEQRLAAIENRAGAISGLVAQARAAETNLEPLIQRVETIIARAGTASQKLQDRDAQVRDLAGKLNAAIKEIRRIHTGLRQTAARTNRAQHGAEAALNRLVAQTQVSRQLADTMAQLLHRTVSRGVRSRHESAMKMASSSRIDVIGTADAVESPTGERESVRNMLTNTRKSLSEFRACARKTGDANTTRSIRPQADPIPTQDNHATHRLEKQVEGLLDAVAPE